ncbi:hypothetical protein [Allomesorhizobium camelthorni]|uniref:hypothetical protein n=1 Tax=Allomesorhizobium camelthorni TaxID=475069 RepID=UPI00197F8FF6|nr:hypothetical protein [Mesorhizobium camelthorni]
MSPTAATSPADTARLTPVIVSSRLIAASLMRALGNLPVKHAEIVTQPVQFPDMAVDCGAIVMWHRLTGEPGTTEA